MTKELILEKGTKYVVKHRNGIIRINTWLGDHWLNHNFGANEITHIYKIDKKLQEEKENILKWKEQ